MQDARRYGDAPMLELRDLTRSYKQGDREINVLLGATAALYPGQAVALVGPSGAGKSTFLHICGLLETPTQGHVFVAGQDCTRMNDAERTRVRRARMGFVYQFHLLLPEFSALENVVMPQLIQGKPRKVAEVRAAEILTMLGLGHRLDHRPAEMSGGEQQRTAIARALANAPRILLADEPTGNLDPKTSGGVFEELTHLIRTTGVAALIATHNLELARRMDRVLRMENGQLVELDPASLRA